MGDDESYTIQMTVAEDRKSFEIKLESTIEMTASDIVIAIECWCRDNLMEGYSFEDTSH